MRQMELSISKFNRIYIKRLAMVLILFLVSIGLTTISIECNAFENNRGLETIIYMLTVLSSIGMLVYTQYYLVTLDMLRQSFIVISDECFTYYKHRCFMRNDTVVCNIGNINNIECIKHKEYVVIKGNIQTYVREGNRHSKICVREVEKVSIPNVFEGLDTIKAFEYK